LLGSDHRRLLFWRTQPWVVPILGRANLGCAKITLAPRFRLVHEALRALQMQSAGLLRFFKLPARAAMQNEMRLNVHGRA
jgi:hypothetical protein